VQYTSAVACALHEPTKQWFFYDDGHCSPLTSDCLIPTRGAGILFYKRREC